MITSRNTPKMKATENKISKIKKFLDINIISSQNINA